MVMRPRGMFDQYCEKGRLELFMRGFCGVSIKWSLASNGNSWEFKMQLCDLTLIGEKLEPQILIDANQFL